MEDSINSEGHRYNLLYHFNSSISQNKIIKRKNLMQIITHLANLMIQAQITISRAFRRRKIRKIRKTHFLADIYYQDLKFSGEDVYLIGDFSKNPWDEKIKMKYSFSERCYTTRILLLNW